MADEKTPEQVAAETALDEAESTVAKNDVLEAYLKTLGITGTADLLREVFDEDEIQDLIADLDD